MIETINSNESKEGNSANRVQNSFKMPKNVRQIGKSNVNKKIYVEDYVMTYIKQLAGGDYSACKVAVLVGQCIRLDNCRNIFISGAVEVGDVDFTAETILTNDTWGKIYEEIKKYFVETEIVGWFIGGPGYLLEDKDKITKVHVDNFAGQDKTLLTFDSMEKEENFYSYEGSRLTKLEGYYIYYEKNEEMQTYMIDHKDAQSNEVNYDDRVSREIRTVLQTKKAPVEESKSITRLMYAAGTLLAVIVLVVGAAILNNYDQMKSMQDTLNYLSQNMEEVQTAVADDRMTESIDSQTAVVEGQASDVSADGASSEKLTTGNEESDGDGNLEVEVVPGDVKPLEKTQETNSDTSEPAADNDEEADLTQEDKETSAEKPADKEQAKVSKEEEKQVNYYIVTEGDTLAGISYKLYETYTKVAKIMELNHIEDQDVIYVGQKLIVP
ncbi:MAG: putative rane protein [Firmicutes bacterium]|nr:putative rane protein [Bacillota bacterium]